MTFKGGKKLTNKNKTSLKQTKKKKKQRARRQCKSSVSSYKRNKTMIHSLTKRLDEKNKENDLLILEVNRLKNKIKKLKMR